MTDTKARYIDDIVSAYIIGSTLKCKPADNLNRWKNIINNTKCRNGRFNGEFLLF